MNDHLLPDMDMPIEDGEEEIEQGDLFTEAEPGFFDGRERFIGHDCMRFICGKKQTFQTHDL